MRKPKLFLVGPLGGLWQDVSLCSRRILQEASLIVTQDVVSVRAWLEQGNVDTPLLGMRDSEALATVLAALHVGDVAWLCMDLAELDSLALGLLGSLLERGIEPLSIPGPSHLTAGLAVSGLPAGSLTFLGTLTGRSSERRALLEPVADEPHTCLCQVAADRVVQALQDVVACLGDRWVVLYGERGVWRGQAGQAREWPGKEQLVLLIEGAGSDRTWALERVEDEMIRLLTAGVSSRDAARDLARRAGWSKRQVYKMAIALGMEE